MRSRLPALTLALFALWAPAAHGASGASTPTPQQLWNAYPFRPADARPLPSPAASAESAPRPAETTATGSALRPAPRAVKRGAGVPPALLLVLPVAFVAGMSLERRRRRARRPVPAAPPAAPATARPARRTFAAPPRPAPPPPPPPPARGASADGVVAPWTGEVPWPAGSERDWRSEIVWREREFRVTKLAPGTQKPTSIGSPGDPTPARRTELDVLAETLEREGWTPVEAGQRWYGHRYVWTQDGSPPGTERTDP